MKKKQSREYGAFNPRVFLAFILCSIGASLAIAAVVTELVPGTAVLLNQSGSSGSGNGGNATSTSSSTNIFSPAAFVDYKRFGGEPTVVVDRYPFEPGDGPSCKNAAGVVSNSCQQEASCPPATVSCFKDIAYASAPNGFVYPHYSPFWKSNDLGQTFRVPQHVPSYGTTLANAGGGGDSHNAIGQRTHRVFFVDLPGPGCVTRATPRRAATTCCAVAGET